MNVKLNVLLAKTDALGQEFKRALQNYIKFFTKNQGAFFGEKKTYEPKDQTVDDPKLRSNQLVVTTVDEKLDYFSLSSKDYIDSLFDQEATNASGAAKADLIFDDIKWKDLSTLELLRLKSLIDSPEFKSMYSSIPVRSDAVEWNPTVEESYEGRKGIYENPLVRTENKTTEKVDYILEDPNISKIDGASYTPKVAQKTTTVTLGEGSRQIFTGAFSQREKAEVLSRISKLRVAVIQALKEANEVESVKSSITADSLFAYLHKK